MNLVTGKDIWRGEAVYMMYDPKKGTFRVWKGKKTGAKNAQEVLPSMIRVTKGFDESTD